MGFFNYHATVKKMIREGKLTGYYYTERYKNIGPALILLFNDRRRNKAPIRPHKWLEYEELIDEFFK